MTEEDKLQPEVYKVIGAPGTGKTTRVVGNPEIENHTSLVQQNLNEYPWEDQMIVTYTKAGTLEAAERLSKILDAPKYKIDDRVRTIHSVCYHLLDVDQDQVVQWWDKKNFCKQYDLGFGNDDEADDLMADDAEEGNLFFDIYGWLQSNRKSKEQYKQCPSEWDGEWEYEFLHERWEEWKSDRNKIGFGDMIERVVSKGRSQLENLGWGVLFPDEGTTDTEMFKSARDDPQRDPAVIRGKGAFVDTRVLYVDEVQDLTPLQWDWYLLQKLVCEKVYIGGDDDQTIYGWAGANPDFMLGEEGDFEVLDKTYRIPAEVWETCDGVIRQVDERQEKNVTPHGDGGEVVTLQRPSARQVIEHAQDGSVFILFRARYMIDEFTKKLHSYGIPYENMSTFETWSNDVVTLRNALAKVEEYHDRSNDKTPKLTGDELQVLKDYADDDMLTSKSLDDPTEQVFQNFGGVSVEKVDEMFNLPSAYSSRNLTAEKYIQSTEEVNYYQGQAILGNIKEGNTDMVPERVKIGTIHSSKGKEAETVILALDSTTTILDNMYEDVMNDPSKVISDAERRVYYVGMTRASQKLVLCEGILDANTTLHLDDLLDDYSATEEWQQNQLTSDSSW